ncbi:MrcB family domain-containing protein [Nocardia sp. NPDC057030]|uniref:MrcB family domain-containing protein n=1 Tax=unclassified Nocardia TaxID=2637762 RepID=UPI00363C3FA5
MSLRDLLDEVLTLQPNFTTDAEDPSMVRRRELVNKEIPGWIAAELASSFPKWHTEGSGGRGTPALIPWSRYCDHDRSPKAGVGWYAVYLFSATGDAAYLSLNQGTSPFDPIRQRIIPLPDDVVTTRTNWARSALTAGGAAPATFDTIDLRTTNGLGHAYELGNIHGIRYSAGSIPSDDQLRQDFSRIGELLDRLYQIDDETAFIPGDVAPEIVDAEVAAVESAGHPRRAAGQGSGLSHAEKTAIEDHSVKLAIEHFKARHYTVQNTGKKKSYDLLATLGSEKVYVEVKGTVSRGEQVILTYNEVEHHLEVHPNNALVVVHSIDLDRKQTPPVASGGTVVVHQPWQINVTMLRPISYRYTTPPA